MGLRTGAKNGNVKGQELLEFESVKSWIDSLEQSAISRGKPFSLMAKRQRLGRLLEYTKNTGLNPDQLLQEAKEDMGKAGKRLTDYLQAKVKAGADWNTAVTNISFLRGFYTHNDLHFPKKFKTPKRQVSAVSKRDSKTEIYGYDEDTDKVIFHNGTLQHFIQNLNFRDQTIALCLLSTGADATDLLRLKVSFVKDAKGKISNAKRFLWHDNRAKDGIEFKVYFSEEATQFLKRYVEQERADANDKDYLFVKENNAQLPAHALAMNFRVASEKMGFTVDDQSNPFRPKRFRHLFRTASSNAGVDSGFILAFMGHASDISASYLEKSDGLFLKEYVKVEPFITVFGVDDKSTITEMTETVTEIKSSIADLAVEKDSLKKRLESTEKDLEERKAEVETLKNQLEAMKAENARLQKGTDERMNYFSTKIDKFETYISEREKEEKKKKKPDYTVNY